MKHGPIIHFRKLDTSLETIVSREKHTIWLRKDCDELSLKSENVLLRECLSNEWIAYLIIPPTSN
jgi:hypothetical protein